MSAIEDLLAEYERQAGAPWPTGLAAPQRVWFAIYKPEQERRLRLRFDAFEAATHKQGHGWKRVDITPFFAEWMAANEYREEYFREPELMTYALDDFVETLAGRIKSELAAPGVDDQTVVALSGVASLFGIARVSELVDAVSSAIRGRLLVFFPGDHDEQNNFRFLDARDGWNYLAVVIKARK